MPSWQAELPFLIPLVGYVFKMSPHPILGQSSQSTQLIGMKVTSLFLPWKIVLKKEKPHTQFVQSLESMYSGSQGLLFFNPAISKTPR